jgi:hypothetical protein
MIPVIISGMSPGSYERMLQKKALNKSIPLRTSQRVKNRKNKISKRRNQQKEIQKVA